MKAKDTVMSRRKSVRYQSYACLCSHDECLLAQAKITWKAREPEIEEARKVGYDQGFLDTNDLIAEANYKAGIREVVDYLISDNNGLIIQMNGSQRGKKLKDRGLSEERGK